MEKNNSSTPSIIEEIQKIFETVRSGSLDALSVDLNPIFQKFKRAINAQNLNESSSAFSKLCDIIETKFNELQMYLALFGQEKKFLTFLESNPSDIEVFSLFKGCWYKPYNLNALSLDFLEESKNSLESRVREGYIIENLEIPLKDENFILEIPSSSFQKTIENYFNKIYKKLPCNMDDLFEELESQEEIYEKFIIILHLLQNGKIMYQKQTNFIYVPEGGKDE